MERSEKIAKLKTYSILYVFPKGQIGLPQLGYIIVEATNQIQAKRIARHQVAAGKYKMRWGPVLV